MDLFWRLGGLGVFVRGFIESTIGPEKEFSQLRLWVPAVAVMTTLAISSHFSGPPAAPNIVGFDKVAHFFVFGLLGTLLFRRLRVDFFEHRRWILAWLGVLAYAFADEVLQHFNPGRSFDPWDWVADGTGSLLAILLYRGWGWYRRLLETKLGRRLAKEGRVFSSFGLMSKASDLKKIEKLRAEVRRHDELYYRKAIPEISDFEHDGLKRELAGLEAANPELPLDASPTVAVGDDRVEGFASYRHLLPMQSLDNTYSEDEFVAFVGRVEKGLEIEKPSLTVEPKIDGVAVSLTYEKGELVRAVTRGNGIEGDDVTANVRFIESLPTTLQGTVLPDLIEIRGEIFMQVEEFERLNVERREAGLEEFKNPRNLAAESIEDDMGAVVRSEKIATTDRV